MIKICYYVNYNMIWKQLSHRNSRIMITKLLYKSTEYINLFKQSQVFKYTLYLHHVKTSLSSLQFTFKLKALALFALSPKNQECFCKYGNHKTIEILCWKSKNLKDKVIHLFTVTRILWSFYTALICVEAPMNRFRHRHFDIFADISFSPGIYPSNFDVR